MQLRRVVTIVFFKVKLILKAKQFYTVHKIMIKTFIFVSSPTCGSVYVKSYNFVFEKINMEDVACHLSPKTTRFCLRTRGILPLLTRAHAASQQLGITTCYRSVVVCKWPCSLFITMFQDDRRTVPKLLALFTSNLQGELRWS